MLRVLHSVSNMDRGGIETMLMNYYRHIDRDRIQFDFLCNKRKPGAYDEEIMRMGGRIFCAPGLNPLMFPRYLRYMKKLFDEHPEYRILHAHNGALGVYALYAAKVNGLPVRVFHAHNTQITFDLKWPVKTICMFFLPDVCNVHWTCGTEAARCYFGSTLVKNGDCVFVRNAIEIDRFVFRKDIREKMRRENGLESKTVIGHIGRFGRQKNHRFIISIFDQLHQADANSALVLIGDGVLKSNIMRLVNEMGLANDVHFLGIVENPHEWYQAFDAFLLPSRWEGLPLVGVEAQAASLPSFFSDGVPRETEVTDRASFLPLSSKPSVWANALLRSIQNNDRVDMTEQIINSGYDIRVEAKNLQARYESLTANMQ